MLKDKRCKIRTWSGILAYLSPMSVLLYIILWSASLVLQNCPCLLHCAGRLCFWPPPTHCYLKHNKQQQIKTIHTTKIRWWMQWLFAQILAYSSCWSQGLWPTAEKQHAAGCCIISSDLSYTSEHHVSFTAVWSLFTFSQLEDNLLSYLNTWKRTTEHLVSRFKQCWWEEKHSANIVLFIPVWTGNVILVRLQQVPAHISETLRNTVRGSTTQANRGTGCRENEHFQASR